MLLAFLILTGGVASAARINARAKNQDVAVGDSAEISTTTVSITSSVLPNATGNVKLYQTDNGYYYYDVTNVTYASLP
jgi:hypothetical protein